MKKIGKIIQNERELKKLDLDEIYQATKIQKKYLIAIEDGDMSIFSAEIYYKGFMKSYAKYLGLDEELLADEYEKSKNIISDMSSGEEKDNSKKEEIKDIPKPKKERKPSETKKLLIILLIAVCLLLPLIYLNGKISDLVLEDDDIKAKIEAERDSVKSKKVIELDIDPFLIFPEEKVGNTIGSEQSIVVHENEVIKEEPKIAAAPEPKIILKVEALENVWIRVESDGKEQFQGTIKKGSIKTWESDNNFTLKVEYTPGVKVWFNNDIVDVQTGSVSDINTVVLRRQS